MSLTQYQQAPVKTSDGRPWAQNCFICNRQIDFLKDPSGYKWLRIGELVRHRKCFPGLPR
jgi:hypothetical protein